MAGRRKEILLLVMAVLMLGVAVWTFKPKRTPPPAPVAAPERARPSEPPATEAKAGEQTSTKQKGATGGGAAKGEQRNPFSAPGAPAVAAAPAGAGEPAAGEPQAGVTVQPAPAGPQPAASGPGSEEQPSLTLTGVLSGRPTMAVLRQNDQRYFVKVGDTVGDGYRVQSITGQQVVLVGQQGKLILRMGGRQ